MEIISLKNINFGYGVKKSNSDFYLKNLDLAIKKGEFISILGPNGSGKSTLLKIIANILKPQSGSRFLYDNDYSEISRKKFAQKVAFVPQNTGTNFPFSIYEIVMMGRAPYLNLLGIEGDNDYKMVNETMELLEIAHLRNKGINEVSGGEAQRALIARAIVQNPNILLLDEPNTHLDIKHQLGIFNILNSFNKENDITVIIISHDLNLSNYFSSRAILMNSGRILFDSTPKEVLSESRIEQVFGVNSKIIFDSETNKSYISLIN
jgi:iron complex transport system ATP-binding protein